MKYIAYYEFKQADLDKVIELFQTMQQMRERDPSKFPKTISQTYWFHSQMKGFTLYDVENEEQIMNHYIHYHPWVTFTWKSISESIDFIQLYKK